MYGTSTTFSSSGRNNRILRVDLANSEEVSRALLVALPDEIYHLSSFHYSSEYSVSDYCSFVQKHYRANLLSTLNILNQTFRKLPRTKVFFASSAQVFGDAISMPQTELTPRRPKTMYGFFKSLCMNLCDWYRAKGLFITVGILYNHESPLRRPDYLSRKVVKGVADIVNHRTNSLFLRDLDALGDWGYALDYVQAMHRVLQLDKSDEFIISTGQLHSVREFVETAFECAGLDWREYVKTNPSFLQQKSPRNLVGDNSKIKTMTGWAPRTSFRDLVKLMLENELRGTNDQWR